jgi:hypothetical protein
MNQKRLTICRHVYNMLVKNDPYAFQNDTVCKCEHMCKLRHGETHKGYFPKNYSEFVKITRIIMKDDDIR